MNSASLAIVGDCLANVGAAVAERSRQEGHGAEPNHEAFDDCLVREAMRVRGEGLGKLADALAGLRGDEGVTSNG